MTNDLLDKDPGAGQTPAEGEEAGLLRLLETPPTEEPPEEPQAPAPEEPEPTVFAPSPWERRRSREGEADKAARRQEREAQRMEKRLAQEQKRAQEEERRREAREREEERRQESRRRAEELREEKAKEKRVRRVGTMTLGVSLIAIGVAILAYMLNPGFDVRVVAYLAPVILISLGAEVLIRYFFSKDRTYKYDFASGIICIFLVIGSFSVSLLPYVVYYIGPERFASEEELLDAQREKLYQALRGDQRVQDYTVNGGIDHSLAAVRRGDDDRWIYQLSYLYVNVVLLDGSPDEAAFAQTCRELLDRLIDQGVAMSDRNSSYIRFHCPENEEGVSYDLYIHNRLQAEMDAAALAKLVEATYTRPSLENGWVPGGYDELEADFGTRYADHFAWLMEDYGTEAASTYYSLLYNYNEDVAERYYESVLAEAASRYPEGQPPAEEGEGESGEPVDGAEAMQPQSDSAQEPPPAAEGAESLPPPEESQPAA